MPVAERPAGSHCAIHKSQKLKDELRSRFLRKSLGKLLFRQRRVLSNVAGRVVQIATENAKRMEWPMGLITETIPRKYWEHRFAHIRTSGGVVMRPVKCLSPPEVQVAAEDIPPEVAEELEDH